MADLILGESAGGWLNLVERWFVELACRKLRHSGRDAAAAAAEEADAAHSGGHPVAGGQQLVDDVESSPGRGLVMRDGDSCRAEAIPIVLSLKVGGQWRGALLLAGACNS
ncbi:hypothetical protein [Streptomyces griseus]|uniref:hypothetical protein n=1 Tax=Streptomyces griseus TaxID=1911 RepID=UPI00131C4788|nr:hypothetical protein [Streptomyces griseus]